MELTTDQENEVARARKLALIRDRARIFREVFGPHGQPTPHGKIILEALREKFGHSLPPNVLIIKGAPMRIRPGDDSGTSMYLNT